MRLFLKLASINNQDIYQLDVNCSHLNAKLNEEVYLKIPMYDEGKEKGKVWKLFLIKITKYIKYFFKIYNIFYEK